MSLLLPERRGVQAPRFLTAPPRVSSAAPEVIGLCESAGVALDPWQKADLEVVCGEREDGTWAAFEAALIDQRQNGKGVEVMARQLGGLFLFGERLQTHTAHRLDTCLEHFFRVRDVIEGTPDFLRRTKRIINTNGAEAIVLMSGQRLLFKARSKEAGRGFSGTTIYLDEALYLMLKSLGAMIPTLSAQPNPQLIFSSSFPKEGVEGEVLRRLIRRGRAGTSARLAYIEYSAEMPLPGEDLAKVARDRRRWYQANPALGIIRADGTGLTEEMTENELDAMPLEDFLLERLGIWFDPDSGEEPEHVLGRERWKACKDPSSVATEPMRLALDVAVDRGHAAFAVAAPSQNGGTHLEVVDYRAGTDWIIQRATSKPTPGPLLVAAKSPASTFTEALRAKGVEVQEVTVEEHAEGCANLFDDVQAGRVRHLGQSELDAAVKAAEKRFYGNESYLWSRSKSSGDICPLVAVTLAAWAVAQADAEPFFITT